MSKRRPLTPLGLAFTLTPKGLDVLGGPHKPREVFLYTRSMNVALKRLRATYGDFTIHEARREREGARCRLVTDGWVAK